MEITSRPLFCFLKIFTLDKSKWSAAWFHYILIALKFACNRNKLFKTLHYWSRYMLNFDFLDKGLGIVNCPILDTQMFVSVSPKNIMSLNSKFLDYDSWNLNIEIWWTISVWNYCVMFLRLWQLWTI